MTIWYFSGNFPRFGILCKEKSGNPVVSESAWWLFDPKNCLENSFDANQDPK
jgi:hypothetical protein